jgi:hypothetical protein
VLFYLDSSPFKYSLISFVLCYLIIDLRTLQKEFSSATTFSKELDFGVYLGDLESVFGLLLELVD